MLRIALRNLFQNKVRLAIAVGGVALALMLTWRLMPWSAGQKPG
jgi:hypothetical protein